MLHDFNPTWRNEFFGFTSTESEVPFVGNIDTTPDYEFTGSMDPPPTYQIVEVHEANMIGIATWIGCGVDRLPPPP